MSNPYTKLWKTALSLFFLGKSGGVSRAAERTELTHRRPSSTQGDIAVGPSYQSIVRSYSMEILFGPIFVNYDLTSIFSQ
jgi:hypothetical protein